MLLYLNTLSNSQTSVEANRRGLKETGNMASTTNLRSSSSFPNLLLSALNLLLLFFSSASFVPTFLFRVPPTSFGWALFTVSATTALSALLGFYSRLTHFCFVTHVSFILASSVGQALGFLSLFLRPDASLRLLGSARSRREQRVLMRLAEGLLLGMFLVQAVVLVSACVMQRWWAREYKELESDREAAARKRSRRMARVQEEAMAEVKARELDGEIRSKYAQWPVKNEL